MVNNSEERRRNSDVSPTVLFLLTHDSHRHVESTGSIYFYRQLLQNYYPDRGQRERAISTYVLNGRDQRHILQ